MTGSTVPDGFITETRGDLPGVSLNGGLDGSGEKLAEQIQAKFIESDARIAALTARVNALENGTGGIGWIPIATGNNSGATFPVDLTAGGKFPSPPLWNLVRVHMRVDLDEVGEVRLQINGENDQVYRSGSSMLDSVVPANTDPANWHREAQPTWSIAHLSTISTGNLVLTLFHTAANPGLLNFQCLSSRHSSDASVHRHTFASGQVTTAKTLTSLLFRTGAGATSFVNAWWWAEGLRMEPPL